MLAQWFMRFFILLSQAMAVPESSVLRRCLASTAARFKYLLKTITCGQLAPWAVGPRY
jgi:hypothetical protein